MDADERRKERNNIMNTINVEAGDMGLVIGFVLLIGGIIKNFTPVKNELIPLITWALGGLLYQWLSDGWTDPRQWMMALLSVAGATGLHSATRSTVEVVKPGAVVPLLGLIGLLLVTGCGTTGQRPPSVTEQKYYDVVTNVVPVVVTAETSNIQHPTSNVEGPKPATNFVEQYTLTPNANAQAVVATGAAVGSIWGAGTTVGAVLLGLFTSWGIWRSRKQPVATAEELAQIIETGRQVLLSLPDGAKYEAAWKDWMVKHQAHTGVISQVSQLVATAVDKDKAKGAAQAIVNLIQAAQATAAK
jgi:hypothetical protein